MEFLLTVLLLILVSLLIKTWYALILKPKRLRLKLRKQGIRGPQPMILFGNILEMKKATSQVQSPPRVEEGIDHNCSSMLFPSFQQWNKQYGISFFLL